MGEMADFLNDQIDSALAHALDNEFDDDFVPHYNPYKECSCCGTKGLQWHLYQNGKWRLSTFKAGRAVQHVCPWWPHDNPERTKSYGTSDE